MLIAIILAAGSLGVYAQKPNVEQKPGRPDVRPGIDIRMPDLVVTSFQLAGPPVVANGAAEVPVRLVVKNQGNGAAPIFKVGVEYNRAGVGGPLAVAFDVPDQADNWRPATTAELAAGKSVTFNGRLKFHPSAHRIRVWLRASADSCAGDEFMPDFCRARESSERNNLSALLWVVLP
jgi:hypothetical protein